MRRSSVVLMAAVLMVPALGLMQPAGAVGGTVCANETGSAAITPGLSLHPHDQTFVVTESLAGCAGGGVKMAKAKATLKYLAQTCLGLTKAGVKTALHDTITWNTGASSTVDGTITTGPRIGQASVTGKVTAGVFVGLHVKNKVSYTLSGLQCGVTTLIKTLHFKGVTSFSIS